MLKTSQSLRVLVVGVLAAVLALMIQADPVFECTDRDTGELSYKNFTGYQECGVWCDCQVFEHMCLVRQEDKTFSLEHRSLEFEADCNPPECLCNSEETIITPDMTEEEIFIETISDYVTGSKIALNGTQMGYRTSVPVPQYTELVTNVQRGSYNFYLFEQFSLPTDDDHDFGHPFKELIQGDDLLQRIVYSDKETDFDTFMWGCYQPAQDQNFSTETQEEEVVEPDETETETEANTDAGENAAEEETVIDENADDAGDRRRRRLQDGTETADIVEGETSQEGDATVQDPEASAEGELTVEDEEEVPVVEEEVPQEEEEEELIIFEADNDVPPNTLVCDLHYEKSWEYRRRFQMACPDITRFTKPCEGTYACLCKHGDKEYYVVSKTMPVVPQTYSGLTTALARIWDTDFVKETDAETADSEEEVSEGLSDTVKLIIYISAGVIGGLCLCCCLYYCFMCCASSSHKVTYIEESKEAKALARKKRKQDALDKANTDAAESDGRQESARPYRKDENTSSKLSGRSMKDGLADLEAGSIRSHNDPMMNNSGAFAKSADLNSRQMVDGTKDSYRSNPKAAKQNDSVAGSQRSGRSKKRSGRNGELSGTAEDMGQHLEAGRNAQVKESTEFS